MKRTPNRAATVLVLLLPAVGACAKKNVPAATPIPVKVHVVQGASGGAGQRYSATIRPDVQVDLAFKVSGYIESILEVTGADGRRRNVQEGDVVRKGSVLARVRDGEYRDGYEEARATMTKARGDFERAAQLYENRTVSKADYDAAAAQLAAAQARFNQAQTTLEDCALRATLDGWLIKRSIEVGSLVSPGSPAFVIADMHSVKAVVGVPDVAIESVRLGQTQTVRCEATPGVVFNGTVTRIAPSADPSSRMFEVECTIPNVDNRLKAGMIASLELGREADARPAALVPLNSIVRPKSDPRGYATFVVEDAAGGAVARERPVQLGEVRGNLIAVTSGLAPGDRVVVVGATLIADGAEVVVVP